MFATLCFDDFVVDLAGVWIRCNDFTLPVGLWWLFGLILMFCWVLCLFDGFVLALFCCWVDVGCVGGFRGALGCGLFG